MIKPNLSRNRGNPVIVNRPTRSDDGRAERNPERLAKIIAELNAKLERAIEYYEYDAADGLDADSLQRDLELIENCRAELAKYQ